MQCLLDIAACAKIDGFCRYIVFLSLHTWLGLAGWRTALWRSFESELGLSAGAQLFHLDHLSGNSHQPASPHLAYSLNLHRVPPCDITSSASAGPWEKPMGPAGILPSPQLLPICLLPRTTTHHFRSSINADNCRIKLQFIIFSGCRYADDMGPRCIYIQIEDFY